MQLNLVAVAGDAGSDDGQCGEYVGLGRCLYLPRVDSSVWFSSDRK